VQRSRPVAALAFGYFVVGTGAFVVAGLLNELAQDLSTSVAAAGQLIAGYSLALAIGAPLLAPLAARFERRTLIASGLVLFGLLHVAAAVAPTYGALAGCRVLAGLAAAIVTPHSIAAAGLSAAPGRSGRAVASVFLGFTLSIVIGIPLGNALGSALGWRVALGLVGALALAGAVWIARAIPARLPNEPADRKAWRALAGNAALRWVLLTTILQCAGQFTLYTYLAPALSESLGAGAIGIGLLFGWFGISGLVGNFIASRVLDRLGPARVVAACVVLIVVAFALWPVATGSMAATMLAILVWGLGGFAIHPAQQARLPAIAPGLASASVALNLSATYLGQMVGSVLGGGLIGWLGTVALAWGGAALVVAAGAAAFAAGRAQAREI
jgi:predicted MFS family arabinose efflux permease